MKKSPRPKVPKKRHGAPVSSDPRDRLTEYLLSVIENPNAEPKRRDEMASHLSKMMASPQTRAPRPTAAPRGPAQPRVSTYVSKKREAEAESKTAYKGSSWDGLVNGSAHKRSIQLGDEE